MSCSSIAMLQERFRQLEKMKEMREERELLKLISVSPNNHQQCPKNLYEPSHMFFHSEIIFPTRLPYSFDSQLLSLSLWPKKKHDYSYWDIDIQNITNSTHDDHNLTTKPSWLTDVPMAPPSVIKNALDETSHLTSEVDTTLHL